MSDHKKTMHYILGFLIISWYFQPRCSIESKIQHLELRGISDPVPHYPLSPVQVCHPEMQLK